jgi:hypothetical protein
VRSVKFYALLCNQPAPNDFHSPLSPAPGSHHFIFYHYDSYKKNHTVFVLLWGPCFISYNVSKFHPILACQNSPPVLRLRDSPLGMHTKFCWPIDPSMSRGHFHLLALRWLWRVWIYSWLQQIQLPYFERCNEFRITKAKHITPLWCPGSCLP